MRTHAREWESKAKANKDAADELEKLRAANLSEQEKAIARAESAESELRQLRASAERAEMYARVASRSGLPLEVIQALNGMDEDLEDIANRQYEREYESKVEAFYPDEDARHAFDALDEHYGTVLDATCQRYDPDNIILDYLQNSPYEPVMRNIIYKNGPLQEELFQQFGSRQIANATRVQILRQLESQVKAFYAREQGAQPEQQAAPRTAQNGAATQQRRFTLPPKKDAPAATATAPAATQPAVPAQATAPAPAPAQPTMSSGVTGSLTRGNEGGGAIDESAEANAIFKKLFG
jgi:(p)ppGpp synthase/HD superfamily hydrolase